ncbi:MAG TPA: redoxin domain-containing protein [Nitrososphaerales archaeon]|nr:redoxin domain-containing protein [Nitrososphaerales archaeon]
MVVETGQNAPDAELIDTERKPVKISDFKGKTTVLAFFPGAFTGVCTKEMCTFRDSISKFNSVNANVVGISVDSPFSNKAFKDTNKLNFTILSDYARNGVHTYGVALDNFAGLQGYTAAQRSVFVLDRDGVVRFKWIAENPGIEPNYEQVAKEVEKLR